MTDERYLLDNAAPETELRFSGLERAFDQVTFRHLAARGVAPGWRCLEVGAGGGSVARWLGEVVGSFGYVLATDLDTRWLDTGGLPQVDKRDHNIVSDELDSESFDLVHARLVLGHLPQRNIVVGRLVEALRPGGWLVIENFDTIIPQCLDAVTEDEKTFVRVGDAFTEALHRRGGDTTYARTLPRALRAAGLVDVHASGHVEFLTAGTPGADVQRANIDQVGPGMIKAGLVTRDEVATFLRLLDDHSFTGNLPLFITAWGVGPELGLREARSGRATSARRGAL